MGEPHTVHGTDVSLDMSSGSDYKDENEAEPAPDNAGTTEGAGFGCMAIARTALRVSEFILSLICFSLVAAAQTKSLGVAEGITYSGSGVLSFSGAAFLLAVAVIACVYAAVAAVLLLLAIMHPASELTYKLPRPLLITDFITLLLLFSAACTVGAEVQTCSSLASSTSQLATLAGATASAASSLLSSLQYVCNLVAGASAMGFLASFCFMADFWLTLIPVFVEI